MGDSGMDYRSINIGYSQILDQNMKMKFKEFINE